MTKRRIHVEPIKRWTPAEDEIVRARFPHERSSDLLAALPGRSLTSVRARARLMGLSKSQEFLASPAAGRLDGVRGSATRFQKGQVPWTKGKHFVAGGRSAETRFKKGEMPHNHVPIGTRRKATIGQWKVKVAEPNAWRFVHRMVWENANGAVPPGKVVSFVDGNPDNCDDLANLALVSRSEIMRKNTFHNYPEPIPQLVMARAALVRKINRRRSA